MLLPLLFFTFPCYHHHFPLDPNVSNYSTLGTSWKHNRTLTWDSSLVASKEIRWIFPSLQAKASLVRCREEVHGTTRRKQTKNLFHQLLTWPSKHVVACHAQTIHGPRCNLLLRTWNLTEIDAIPMYHLSVFFSQLVSPNRTEHYFVQVTCCYLNTTEKISTYNYLAKNWAYVAEKIHCTTANKNHLNR